MLPSLRNRITIALGPSRVTIMEAGRSKRQADHAPVVCPVSGNDGEHPWSSPLAVLADWLHANRRTGARVIVNVADCYARYAVLPWPMGVHRQAELATYAQVCFEEMFGASEAGCAVATDWAKYGKPGVACAMDKRMIDAVQQLLKAHKLRLVSLQTHFVSAYNQHCRSLPREETMFVAAEGGQCVMGIVKNTGWHSLRSVKTKSLSDAELLLLIERESVLQGLSDKAQIHVHADDLDDILDDIGKPLLASKNIKLFGPRARSASAQEAGAL